MISSSKAGRRLAPVVIAASLAACSSFSFSGNKPKAIDENAFPANYRNAILGLIRTSQQYDPTNIREAFISEPALKPVGTVSRYVVCTRFNARNLDRQYTGVTDYVAYFYAGDITQFVKATGDVCAGAAYQPFPEAEKICLADKCT